MVFYPPSSVLIIYCNSSENGNLFYSSGLCLIKLFWAFAAPVEKIQICQTAVSTGKCGDKAQEHPPEHLALSFYLKSKELSFCQSTIYLFWSFLPLIGSQDVFAFREGGFVKTKLLWKVRPILPVDSTRSCVPRGFCWYKQRQAATCQMQDPWMTGTLTEGLFFF